MERFGSDGYRGIIGKSFTRDIVARIVLGVADYIRGRYPELPDEAVLPIGYDTRFLAAEMASFACRLLAKEGFRPLLAEKSCPSPYLAFATRQLEAPVGIQFTASHNPFYYCGIKLKGNHGGSMLPQDVRLVQHYAEQIGADRFAGIPLIEFDAKPEHFDLKKKYAGAVIEATTGEMDKGQYLVVDFMHGTSAGIYRDVLDQHYTLNTELRAKPDPMFGGIKPEPLPKNLAELAARIGYDGHDSIGLAFDGDGDRLAVVDERGTFLGPHEIFCLLLEHLVLNRDFSGPVITTVSMSGLVHRVANKLDCPVFEVPVGFKSVSDAMLAHQAIIGGEESGGTGFGHYLPERDALLMAMLLLEARQVAGAPLHELVADLYERHGRSEFIRYDLLLPEQCTKDDFKMRLRELAELAELASDPVISLNHQDGMKVRTKHGWVLVRQSGTEDLVRVYVEAPDSGQAEAYIRAVIDFLQLREL